MNYEEFALKRSGETDESYIERMCSHREYYGIIWTTLANDINRELGVSRDESWYRKRWKKQQLVADEAFDDTEEKLITMKLMKSKLSDERVQANALFRRFSREETLKEIAHDYAQQMSDKKMLEVYPVRDVDDKCRKAILVISDWHYGLEVDNWLNQYNMEIAKQRISVLIKNTVEECKRFGVEELYVVNLQDLINGRIHLQLRINSRIDVITQTMQVAEILAEMLTELSKHFKVQYYDSLDNHSRIEPNKKDSLELETLARIVPWYLIERLGNNKNIIINKNELAEDIITFTVNGRNVVGVHGDKDKPRNVVKNLTMLTHKQYALVLTGHFHHFSGDEENRAKLISNGSLIGTDDYSKDLRKDSEPSQNLIILSTENEKGFVRCIYPIVVE